MSINVPIFFNAILNISKNSNNNNNSISAVQNHKDDNRLKECACYEQNKQYLVHNNELIVNY